MDLRELPVLNTLKNLKSIIFHNNVEDSNPFCRIRIQYLRALSKLKCINGITVDGLNVEQIINEERGVVIRNSEDDMDPEIQQQYSFQDQNEAEEIRKKQMEETQNNLKMMAKQIKVAKQPNQIPRDNFMAQNTQNNSMNNTYAQQMMMPQFDQLSSKYEDLKMDFVKVQTMLKNSEDEKHKTEAKLESTEKYWINKVKGLEENYRNLLDKLESSRKDVQVAEKNLNVLNEENKRVRYFIPKIYRFSFFYKF